MFEEWSIDRQECWNQIPFCADEYYLHYLPPGVCASKRDWSETEKEQLVKKYKVNRRFKLLFIFIKPVKLS